MNGIKFLLSLSISTALFLFSTAAQSEKLERATFAGGCFWCMEPPFEKLPGVKSAVSGYTGGKEKNPKYEDVARGRTTHVEAVQVVFDPKRISYTDLLEVFWRNVDPNPDHVHGTYSLFTLAGVEI